MIFDEKPPLHAKLIADAMMEIMKPHIDGLIAIVRKAVRPYLQHHRTKYYRHPKRRALRKS
jgi:hypothetical protein